MARNPMGVDARPSIADTNQSDNAPVKRRILARAPAVHALSGRPA